MCRVRSEMQRAVMAALLVGGVSLGVTGCATEDWVKQYVSEQNAPIQAKIGQVDSRVSATDSRVSQVAKETADARNVAQQGVQKADGVNTRLTHATAEHNKLKLVESSELRFKSGQYLLTKEQKTALDAIKERIASNPKYTVQIVGEADKPGSKRDNLTLSLRRTEQVRAYLAAANPGETVHRIAAASVGEELAHAAKSDPEHRQVTVAVYEPAFQ